MINDKDTTSVMCSIMEQVKQFIIEYNSGPDNEFESVQFIDSEHDNLCPQYSIAKVQFQDTT